MCIVLCLNEKPTIKVLKISPLAKLLFVFVILLILIACDSVRVL